MKFILVFISMVSFCVLAAVSPSFPCAKAKTPVEKAICESTNLPYLDHALNETYTGKLRMLPAGEKEKLKTEQKAWVRFRDEYFAKAGSKCMERIYNIREMNIRTGFKGGFLPVTKKVTGQNNLEIEAQVYPFQDGSDLLALTFQKKGWSQTIRFCDQGFFLREKDEFGLSPTLENIVSFFDYNFDGILDLAIFVDRGATGNQQSYIYLFDKKKNAYINHEQLSQLTSLSADPKTKLVYSYDKNGPEHYSATYKWNGDSLELVESEKLNNYVPVDGE